MKHKVRVTVIDKKLYPELQAQYCADPDSGECPCYNIGDEFIFERDGDKDHFWHGGIGTLVKTTANPDTVVGGPEIPFCSEAWDAISRYIYTGLQGRLHHERVDEGRKHHDLLLLRRDKTGNFQGGAD